MKKSILRCHLIDPKKSSRTKAASSGLIGSLIIDLRMAWGSALVSLHSIRARQAITLATDGILNQVERFDSMNSLEQILAGSGID